MIRLTLILIAFTVPASAADLSATFKSVCNSKAVKSAALVDACAGGNMPPTLKDGSRFHARGVGAEVNVIAANITFFK